MDDERLLYKFDKMTSLLLTLETNMIQIGVIKAEEKTKIASVYKAKDPPPLIYRRKEAGHLH